MINQGPARRTDLSLRAEYPDLKTTIYRIDSRRFQIHCENLKTDFEEFNNNFEHSICIIGSNVELTQAPPDKFLEIIPKIQDNEISKNFEGVPMSKVTLFNLLNSKFPDINFYKMDDDKGIVNIHIANYYIQEEKIKKFIFLNKFQKQNLESFLEGFKSNISFNIIVEEFDEKPDLENTPTIFNPVEFLYASKLSRHKTPEFSQRDEALWFDKVDSIFDGSFSKEDLYFFNPNEYSCYVDYSIFPNIDLRNHLFLFQTVYITPPFEKSLELWLKESKISKNEFFELIVKNRIKLLLTQPEYRYYGVDFFNEIYKINPTAIISRRGVSCLQQIDIVEMANNYIFNDYDIINEIKVFCELLSQKSPKGDTKLLYDTLVWPVRALRNSFDTINFSGIHSTSVYGVNNIISKISSEVHNQDLEFEFVTNASPIHLSSALNAIYFPFKTPDGYSDVYYATAMGRLLNFYKNATEQNIKAFSQFDKTIETGVSEINPIDIIELNDYVSITELENILSKELVYPNSKHLIESLKNLTLEERKSKIALYNSEVKKRINKAERSKGVIDLGLNAGLDLVSALTGAIGLSTGFSLLKSSTKSFKPIKNIIGKIDEIQNKDIDKANIHFLTKINRVAKLKEF